MTDLIKTENEETPLVLTAEPVIQETLLFDLKKEMTFCCCELEKAIFDVKRKVI